MGRGAAFLGFIGAFLFLSLAVFGEDRLVPSEYATIQAAIDASSNGDTVIVADGTYTGAGNKNIDFGGKAITVCSENGPENCIIDCENSGRGFRFHSGETLSSVLSGLTITNGSAGGFGGGGGIFCENNSSPTISYCTIINNTGKRWAGGAGIFAWESNPLIKNCIVAGNNSIDSVCGGIRVLEGSSTIINCTITGNSSPYSGAGIHSNYSDVTVSNCILWDNLPSETWVGNGTCVITYSDVEGGYPGEGNIDITPFFVDSIAGDYHLFDYSPCIDTGDPCYIPVPSEMDIDGESRVINERIDIGADEVNSVADEPVINFFPEQFEFSALAGDVNLPTQILTIQNVGAGMLNWQISEDCDWISVNPNTGTCPGDESNDVTLYADVTGLRAGNYNSILTIIDPNAANSPRTVPIDMYVYPLTLSYDAEAYAYAHAECAGEQEATDEDLDNKTNSKALAQASAWAFSFIFCAPQEQFVYYEQDSDTRVSAEGTYDPSGARMVSTLKGWGSWSWWDGCSSTGDSGTGGGDGSGYTSLVGIIGIGTFEGYPAGSSGLILKVDAGITGDAPGDWTNWDWWLKIWDDDPNNPLVVLDDNNMSVNLDVLAGQTLNIQLYHTAGSTPSYEWPESGLESTVGIDLELFVPADINRDGYVDLVDYALLANQWLQEPGVPSADIAPPGGDNVVDGLDLGLLVHYWLWEKQ